MVMKGYRRTARLGAFRRLALAFWDSPVDGQITGTMFVDATKALAFAKDVEAREGVKLTMTHFVGRAVALALRQVPHFNSKIIWGTIYEKDTVDAFFQVDVGDGSDLSGVLVERADEKTVVEIAKELRDRAERLRKGGDEQYEKTQKGLLAWMPPKLLRPLMGFLSFLQFNLGISLRRLGVKSDGFGTYMVTSVANFGIDIAYAPLVPVSRVPFIALVGRISDQPWVVDGKLEVRPVVAFSATFDHRFGDGNHIGRMVRFVREYMENPRL